MAKAASRCCELANPAQVRQIASQTEDLLRRMRFVAGRGRCGGEPSGRYCRPGARRRRAIGKMLLAGDAAVDGAKWKSERKSLPLRKRRCDATDAQKTLRCSKCAEAAAMGARKKRRASTDRWHRKSNPAQRLVTPMPAAQEK